MYNPFILATSILMLATAPVIVKFSGLPALVILVWRLVIVCLLLVPLIWKKHKRVLAYDLKHIIVASVFMFAHFMTWFMGVRLLPVGLTTIIYATNPIFTALFGHVFIKEKFEKKFLFAFIFSILGIYIASSDKINSASHKLLGIILIILAAIFYSAYIVYSKHNRKNLDNSLYSFYLNLFTCLIGFVVICLMMFFDFGDLNLENTILFSAHEWLVLFLLAFFPSLLGHSLMTYTVKHFNLNLISCFKLASPLIASTLAYFFFDELVTYKLFLGFSFVAIGVIFALPWRINKRIK